MSLHNRFSRPLFFAPIFAGMLFLLTGCGERVEETVQTDVPSEAVEAAKPETAKAEAAKSEAARPEVAGKEPEKKPAERGNWPNWRGPMQNGTSLEEYEEWSFDPTPAWTYEMRGQGAPVVFEGQVYLMGYRTYSNEDVREYVSALDEETGEMLWEKEFVDFISDTVYNRYSVGSPIVDEETKNIYVKQANGLFSCFSREGEILWQHSMMERFGALTFPNGRTGSAVIEGELVIVREVTSYWGAEGPARDRFFAFEKKTGEPVWSSTAGVGSPFLKDSSHSTPVFETRSGKRVFYVGLGCGNVACINALNGQPIWRYQAAKGGINCSPVLHGGDKLIYVNDKVNVNSSTMGGMVALKLPIDLENPGGEVDAEQGGAPALSQEVELWRNPDVQMFTSSPAVVGDNIYQVTGTGELVCVNASTGELVWKEKLGPDQIHASPLAVDGLLFVPIHEGKLFVIKPTDQGAQIVSTIDYNEDRATDGVELALGSPSVCNGQVYIHTTNRLYCYKLNITGDIVYGKPPLVAAPVAQAPAALQGIPSDILLLPGEREYVGLRAVDKNGVVTGPAGDATWEKFIPPTAKVKSEMEADFEDNRDLVAPDGARASAGAFKATADGLSGVVRGRILERLPYTENFEDFVLLADHPTDKVKFAYPPLPWIGARFKWEIRDLDGGKVLAKTLDSVLFQRALTFIGHPELSNYTLQADVMTDGNRRIKSVVGVLNQRYNISLVGNANVIEVSSNFERFSRTAPFPIEPNQWYTLKTRVDVADDGSGVVRAKAWPRGSEEPAEWTIEASHKTAHKKGAPGLFGFSPQSQKRVFVDNIKISPNE